MHITVKTEMLRKYYGNITKQRKTSKVFTSILMLYKIEKRMILVQNTKIILMHIKMNKKHKRGKNTEERRIKNEGEKNENNKKRTK